MAEQARPPAQVARRQRALEPEGAAVALPARQAEALPPVSLQPAERWPVAAQEEPRAEPQAQPLPSAG